MLILGRQRLQHPDRGFAGTFLRQMEDCLGLAVERGVTIVTNAGGLNPAGLATALRDLAGQLGVHATVASMEGDDVTAQAAELGLGSPLAGASTRFDPQARAPGEWLRSRTIDIPEELL